MLELSPGVVPSPVTSPAASPARSRASSRARLRLAPELLTFGRSSHRARRAVGVRLLAALTGTGLFLASVLSALVLYSMLEVYVLGSLPDLRSAVATSALISGVCALGFLSTLVVARRPWAELPGGARAASTLLAATGILMILGLNTRGPIAFMAGDLWPIGLVIAALGMSVALFALKLGEVLTDAWTPLEMAAREEARWAKRHRLRLALGWSPSRPARAQTPSARRRRTHASTSSAPEARARLSERWRDRAARANLSRPERTPRVDRRAGLPRTLVGGRGGSPRFQPYLENRGTVIVDDTEGRCLGSLRAASPGRKAAQTQRFSNRAPHVQESPTHDPTQETLSRVRR